MNRIAPKLDPNSKLGKKQDIDDRVFELLTGWDERRDYYLARAHRYSATPDGALSAARAAELTEAIEELCLFFPGAKELFEEFA
ncbi:MAG TPA: hypothetical protein VFZ53_05590 [Polyangiaceae bacterium]